MFFSSGAKKELNELPEPVRKRIKATAKYAKIWTGFVLVAAGILFASKPYLDRLRSQDELNKRQMTRPRVKKEEE